MSKRDRRLQKQKKSYDPDKKQHTPFHINQLRLRGPRQTAYVESMYEADIVFGVGPAGSGKTMLATAFALHQLIQGEISKIVITRPVREAGENIGFLPGGLEDKLDPYMRPIFDFLGRFVHHQTLKTYLDQNVIEIAPLAYMRGRSFEDAVIILDEAQNTTPEQMKMFLTRIGRGAQAIVTGDITQADVRGLNGLQDAINKLDGIHGIDIIEFTSDDIVRHNIVTEVVEAYGKRTILPAETCNTG